MENGTPPIIAWGGFAVAIAGVLLTVYQAWRTQDHNKRSVRPLLQLRSDLSQGETAGLVLNNIGLGPAILVSTEMTLDGKPIGGIDEDSVNRLRATLKTRPGASTFVPGEAIAKDATVILLGLSNYDKEKDVEFADLIRRRLKIEIVYKSLYGGKKFTANWPRPGKDDR